MRVIAACEAEAAPELDRLLSRLRRFETEAALEQARALAAGAASDAVGELASVPEVSNPVPQITAELVPQITAEPAPQIGAEPAPQVAAELAPPIPADPAPPVAAEQAPTPQPMPLLIELNGLDDIGVLRGPVEGPPRDAVAQAA
jgi:hypothetical protein